MAARSRSKGEGEGGKLDAGAWTRAALEMLAQRGIDGVRVDVLAKSMGISRGSFYYHFKDRDALCEAMLGHWRRDATLRLIERLDQRVAAPGARLRRLLRLPIAGARSPQAADVELAVRLWGRSDPRAKAALEEVDALRLRYIAGLLLDCGAPAAEAEPRAIIAYAYMRVAATLVAPEALDLMARCEDLVIGDRPNA